MWEISVLGSRGVEDPEILTSQTAVAKGATSFLESRWRVSLQPVVD